MTHASDHCHTDATIEPGKAAELPSRRTIVVALASAEWRSMKRGKAIMPLAA